MAQPEIVELRESMQKTWGQFFRYGTFPEDKIKDIDAEDFPFVNNIDESEQRYTFKKTFESECAALDNGLYGSYLDRSWEDLPISEPISPLRCDGTHCWLTIENGATFKGIDRGEMIELRGIYFADAPVGDLRWKAPVARYYNFGETVDATEWGNMCACHRCFGAQVRDC